MSRKDYINIAQTLIAIKSVIINDFAQTPHGEEDSEQFERLG